MASGKVSLFRCASRWSVINQASSRVNEPLHLVMGIAGEFGDTCAGRRDGLAYGDTDACAASSRDALQVVSDGLVRIDGIGALVSDSNGHHDSFFAGDGDERSRLKLAHLVSSKRGPFRKHADADAPAHSFAHALDGARSAGGVGPIDEKSARAPRHHPEGWPFRHVASGQELPPKQMEHEQDVDGRAMVGDHELRYHCGRSAGSVSIARRALHPNIDAKNAEKRACPLAHVAVAPLVGHLVQALLDRQSRQHHSGQTARGGRPQRSPNLHGKRQILYHRTIECAVLGAESGSCKLGLP